MLTALLPGLAATAIGAVLGIWTSRTLATLNYRLDDEQDLPKPGRRWWIIWTSALSLGSIAAWLAATSSWALAPVLLPLALTGPALAAIDLDVMRLPNRILAPVAAVTILGLASTGVTGGGWATAVSGLIGGLVAGAALMMLNLLTRGGVGIGDIKLAAIIGSAAGAVSLATAWWALLVGSVVALIWAKSIHHRGPFAYGPWLLLGAWIAILDPIGTLTQALGA
ncbi:MAG: prepilin peptidase [Actinobacteria bacterium]|jgi:leader peptidase (prepilin peptidase)/N-methyltransferase|nr:prepilin peptidase [Actinomycetota bacterium]